jgi:hypothetical protein
MWVGFGKYKVAGGHDLNPTSGFQGDDVAIIIDLLEEELME